MVRFQHYFKLTNIFLHLHTKYTLRYAALKMIYFIFKSNSWHPNLLENE